MTWFVVFALSAFGLWYWRQYAVQQRDLESASSPQRKGERFIGQVVTVPKGIENGLGRVQLGPQKWSLRGPDVPAGAQVRITGVDGRVLIVDRMSEPLIPPAGILLDARRRAVAGQDRGQRSGRIPARRLNLKT